MPNGNTSSPAVFTAAPAITLIEQVEASVPGFELADRKVWKTIGRKGGYPDDYVQTAANMVDASPELQAATHFDTAGARAPRSRCRTRSGPSSRKERAFSTASDSPTRNCARRSSTDAIR